MSRLLSSITPPSVSIYLTTDTRLDVLIIIGGDQRSALMPRY
jgi:hypothetical protein